MPGPVTATGGQHTTCVQCEQVEDLLSLVVELKEEVERLRSIWDCGKRIDRWSCARLSLQEGCGENAPQAVGDDLLSTVWWEGATSKTVRDGNKSLFGGPVTATGGQHTTCVQCEQVEDLLSLVVELKEEVERLRSIWDCGKRIDRWSCARLSLQEGCGENAPQAVGDDLLSTVWWEGATSKTVRDGNKSLFGATSGLSLSLSRLPRCPYITGVRLWSWRDWGMWMLVNVHGALPSLWEGHGEDAPQAVEDHLLSHSQVGRGNLKDSKGWKEVPVWGNKQTAPQPVPPSQVPLHNRYEALELDGLGAVDVGESPSVQERLPKASQSAPRFATASVRKKRRAE